MPKYPYGNNVRPTPRRGKPRPTQYFEEETQLPHNLLGDFPRAVKPVSHYPSTHPRNDEPPDMNETAEPLRKSAPHLWDDNEGQTEEEELEGNRHYLRGWMDAGMEREPGSNHPEYLRGYEESSKNPNHRKIEGGKAVPIKKASHMNDLSRESMLNKLAEQGKRLKTESPKPDVPPLGEYVANLPEAKPDMAKPKQMARGATEPKDDIEPEEKEVRGEEPRESEGLKITKCQHCGQSIPEGKPIKMAAGETQWEKLQGQTARAHVAAAGAPPRPPNAKVQPVGRPGQIGPAKSYGHSGQGPDVEGALSERGQARPEGKWQNPIRAGRVDHPFEAGRRE
jgi:hypothetical protein